jgi:curved DNA-binding protein
MLTVNDFKNYYTILIVSPTSDREEIKQAYRNLARQYHPDINPGNCKAEASFKEINEAYEVLSNPEKHQEYDRLRQSNQQLDKITLDTRVNRKEFTIYEDFLNGLLGSDNRDLYSDRPVYSSATSTGESKIVPNFQDVDRSKFASESFAFDKEIPMELSQCQAHYGVYKVLEIDREAINVQIPPERKSGNRIQIKGKGNVSPFSQQRGDLYLIIEVL